MQHYNPKFLLACLAASCAIAATTAYGLSYAWEMASGHGPLVIIAACGAALAISIASPVAFEIALKSETPLGQKIVCGVIALAGVIFAMMAEINLQSTMQKDAATHREAETPEAIVRREARERDKAALAKLADARPVGVVTAEIEALRKDKTLKRSIKTSKISILEIELALSSNRSSLELRLQSSDSQIMRVAEKSQSGVGAALSSALALIRVHASPETAASIGTLLYAVIIETVALFSVVLIVAASRVIPHHSSVPALAAGQGHASSGNMVSSGSVIVPASGNLRLLNVTTATSLEKWFAASIEADSKFWLAATLYKRAQLRGMPNVSYRDFCAELRETPFETKKLSAGKAYKAKVT